VDVKVSVELIFPLQGVVLHKQSEDEEEEEEGEEKELSLK